MLLSEWLTIGKELYCSNHDFLCNQPTFLNPSRFLNALYAQTNSLW